MLHWQFSVHKIKGEERREKLWHFAKQSIGNDFSKPNLKFQYGLNRLLIINWRERDIEVLTNHF